MADTIPEPWICSYLINIAETYGGDLSDSNVPQYTRKRRAQLVQFLTYSDDDQMWVEISDKQFRIPVKLSKEAVLDYRSRYNGERLSGNKFAVVFVKDFRPKFGPIPIGNNQMKMTLLSHLFLHAGFIDVIGSSSEHQFGNPRELEAHDQLREWIHGLRQDGGGGNVLKLRKIQSETILKTDHVGVTAPAPGPQLKNIKRLPLPKSDQQSKTAITSIQKQISSAASISTNDNEDSLLKKYNRSWQAFVNNPWRFFQTPEEVQKHLSSVKLPQLPGELRESPTSTNDNSADPPSQGRAITQTPMKTSNYVDQTSPRLSEWSASVHDSPEHSKILDRDHPVDNRATLHDDNDGELEITRVNNDTPASYSRHPSPGPQRGSKSRSHAAPASSLPSSSFSPSFPASPHILNQMKRKVPRPGRPGNPSQAISDVSSAGQILVPNSDTSGTASQPQSQSLSQIRLASQSTFYPPTFPLALQGSQDLSEKTDAGILRSVNYPADASVEPESHPETGQSAGTSFDVANRPDAECGPSMAVLTESGQDDHSPARVHESKASPTVVPDDIAFMEDSQDQVDELDSYTEEVNGRTDEEVLKHRQEELSDDDAETNEALEKSTHKKTAIDAVVEEVITRSELTKDEGDDASSRGTTTPGKASEPPSLAAQGPTNIPIHSEPPLVASTSHAPPPNRSFSNKGQLHYVEHDAVAWRKPTFLAKKDLKGKGKATGQEKITSVKSHGEKKRSPQGFSPSPSPRKKARRADVPSPYPADNKAPLTPTSHPTRPIGSDKEGQQSHSNGSGSRAGSKISDSIPQLSRHPRSAVTHGVDFDHIPVQHGKGPPWLNWQDIAAIFLQTGRLRNSRASRK